MQIQENMSSTPQESTACEDQFEYWKNRCMLAEKRIDDHISSRDEPDPIFSGPAGAGPDFRGFPRAGVRRTGPDSGLISLKCPKTNGNSCTEIKAKCNNIFNT